MGGFLALWVIGYGIVQASAPGFTKWRGDEVPGAGVVAGWALVLAGVPAVIAVAMGMLPAAPVLIVGLALFGVLFAINSALHSFLIISHARHDGVSLDVGFYYMANAMGRLLGTVLSGWLYQAHGLEACLWVSAAFLVLAGVLSLALPSRDAFPTRQS
nr:hypothetical protein [Alkalisalibacterium limincola]